MRAALLFWLVVLLAPCAPAQIFPPLERTEVLKRAGAAAPDQPATQAGPVVDGAAVLARYNEALAALMASRDEQRKSYEAFVDKTHESVRKYLDAHAMLRLGFYTEAARGFEAVGVQVRREAEIKAPELRKLADEIKSGRAVYFRMLAEVMQLYAPFKDEIELDNAVKAARSRAEPRQREMQRLIREKRVDERAGTSIEREMSGWLGTLKNQWQSAATADKRATDAPQDVKSWELLLDNAGTPGSIASDADNPLPRYLKRRAIVQVLREFWPESRYIVEGTADVAIAISHIGAYQLDQYAAHLQPRPNHTATGKMELGALAEEAAKHVQALARLRNE